MNDATYLTFRLFKINVNIDVDYVKYSNYENIMESDSRDINYSSEEENIKTNVILKQNKSKYSHLKFNNLLTCSITEYLNDNGKIQRHIKQEYKTIDINDKNNDKKNISIRTSTFKYYLINFLSLLSTPKLSFYFTEFEYVPVAVQIFFHVPLVLTAVIVFIIIATFDPDITLEMIREEIDKIPSRKYTNNCNETEYAHDCTICIENFVEDEIVSDLPCGHVFHRSCIEGWLLNNLCCPICRKTVSPLAESESYEMFRNMNI